MLIKFNKYCFYINLLIFFTVDLGGSLAVASRGLHSTGVSTDLNVTYMSSGGKVGKYAYINQVLIFQLFNQLTL